MADVTRMSFEERLAAVLELTAGKVGPEIGAQLRALIQPKSLAIVAGVLALWVASHGFAVGEIIDSIVGLVGVVSIGMAVFTGIDELFEFARGTYNAASDADLNVAAGHLARAIAILGITAVLGILFRGRPATRRADPGPPPPATPGWRYKPTTKSLPTYGPGGGVTSWWGDIEVSSLGSSTDKALVLYHERVHQFLVPKLYLLRNTRVEMRVGSYADSSLYRYLEELLAETVAQVRVSGWKQLFSAIRFPTKNGYVYWVKASSDPRLAVWGGAGVLPEGAGLLASGFMLGVAMKLYFKAGITQSKPANSATRPAMRTGVRAGARH